MAGIEKEGQSQSVRTLAEEIGEIGLGRQNRVYKGGAPVQVEKCLNIRYFIPLPYALREVVEISKNLRIKGPIV